MFEYFKNYILKPNWSKLASVWDIYVISKEDRKKKEREKIEKQRNVRWE
jgi:hypothetical protein